MSMKLKLLAAFLVLATVPAFAAPSVLAGGDGTTVEGLAHVEQGAFGTYVVLERPGAATPVAGYVAFGNGAGFPDLYQLDGQRVAIHGVVSMYGMPLIQMTTPEQIEVVG
jgi:hypothetical protein